MTSFQITLKLHFICTLNGNVYINNNMNLQRMLTEGRTNKKKNKQNKTKPNKKPRSFE